MLLLLAAAAFATYDMQVFQPRRTQIDALLQRAPAEDRAPPALIRRYILAAHPPGAPSSNVARMLLARLEVSREHGMLQSHMHELLWSLLVKLHLSQDEILGLYAALSYNGAGHGLSQVSQRLYAKPLSALSEPEAATVVAVLWSPQIYLRDRTRLERRRDLLMARARAVR
ncbi:transglycosylase domain-containing protein [Xanthomonas tesorieronis]|uniref:transglycosylase domain-containing protein n=1 Tax=Xanthomonas tesorieronis TaxID=3160839 RepID=UPI00351277FE